MKWPLPTLKIRTTQAVLLTLAAASMAIVAGYFLAAPARKSAMAANSAFKSDPALAAGAPAKGAGPASGAGKVGLEETPFWEDAVVPEPLVPRLPTATVIPGLPGNGDPAGTTGGRGAAGRPRLAPFQGSLHAEGSGTDGVTSTGGNAASLSLAGGGGTDPASPSGTTDGETPLQPGNARPPSDGGAGTDGVPEQPSGADNTPPVVKTFSEQMGDLEAAQNVTAMNRLLAQWFVSDPAAATAWVNGTAYFESMSPGMRSVAVLLAGRSHPAEAVDWANAIPDGEIRQATRKVVYAHEYRYGGSVDAADLTRVGFTLEDISQIRGGELTD